MTLDTLANETSVDPRDELIARLYHQWKLTERRFEISRAAERLASHFNRWAYETGARYRYSIADNGKCAIGIDREKDGAETCRGSGRNSSYEAFRELCLEISDWVPGESPDHMCAGWIAGDDTCPAVLAVPKWPTESAAIDELRDELIADFCSGFRDKYEVILAKLRDLANNGDNTRMV
jgi:hypothetical protein